MSGDSKQISSPFSTGGGGGHFEAHVQASFVVLMLTESFVPCIPSWPIIKIKLQGKFAGYDTDDLVIFVKKTKHREERKILGQVKHSISITEKDSVFGEVIQAAWNDFNNPKFFNQKKDVLALITGPLAATDINDTRTILEWARNSENASEFLNKVQLGKFSSKLKRKKLQAFRAKLNAANSNNSVPDEQLYQFLRHFYLLGYDLDVKSGVTSSLFHSLIGQYSQEDALGIWSKIVDEVQFVNKNAGTITRESIPEEIKSAFEKKLYESIPTEFVNRLSPDEPDEPDWGGYKYAASLAIANLAGAWNEKNPDDLEILSQICNTDFRAWNREMREVLQEKPSPVNLKNGYWKILKRKDLWGNLASRIFDSDLDKFKECAVKVLSEHDPKFDLSPEDRFAASVYGKTLKYSPVLRKGIAETLVLLGSGLGNLTNSSQNKPESIAHLVVREVLDKADWVLWGSLDSLLPLLAEAAPNEFLKAVEVTLQQQPCPFDELFSQEGSGVGGSNYLTGLLWALELLAWDEKYLVRVAVIFGELATHDPGGSWANRPENSLTTIFLPWKPQTIAPIDKRKVAIETLQEEFSDIAWKLVISLLPSRHQSSMGTYKPLWRKIIPDNWQKGVTNKEYWEQIFSYAKIAVSMAKNCMSKLNQLVEQLDSLPEQSLQKLLEHISSDAIANKTEEERLPLWNNLVDFTSKHKRFPDAEWALDSETISKIESVTEKLTPKNPLNLNRRFFSNRDHDLYEERDDWDKQREKLEKHRQQILRDILNLGGMDLVIQLAETVEAPFQVGISLSAIANEKIDAFLLPQYLEAKNKEIEDFVCNYVYSQQRNKGWEWVDSLDRSNWSNQQMSFFLRSMSFTKDTWNRAIIWLTDREEEYWNKVNVNPYHTDSDIEIAIEKLIEYGRPMSAIHCLRRLNDGFDKNIAIKALLAALSSKEPSYNMDTFHITKIIEVLQDDPEVNQKNLIDIEWGYFPLLNKYNKAYPKTLENAIASEPESFCQVISYLYRSKNETKESKPKKESSETEKIMARNAFELLRGWKTIPGTQLDGSFSEAQFTKWLEEVKDLCTKSGHLEVAFMYIGQVLTHAPADSEGLWINKTVANALNAKDAEKMREGFTGQFYNSRGVHYVDPTGEPERKLAAKYQKMAEDVENAKYMRLAASLKRLAENYEKEAKRVVMQYAEEEDS